MSIPVSITPYRARKPHSGSCGGPWIMGRGELSVVRFKNEVALEFAVIEGGTYSYMQDQVAAIVLPVELVGDLILELEAIRAAPAVNKRVSVATWYRGGAALRKREGEIDE